ncbi:MAG: hypothetical protein GQ525_05665 [Draconibacterium sp.]|nr:hypothetical protein [Draconibacterium sp.]
MEININNYEAYFIDYLERNLDERLVDEFLEFLQQNPDLKEELSLLETVSIEPENISFNKKENLFKQKLDSEKEFNKASVANLEGDISVSDKLELEKYIAEHTEKKRDILLFDKTKLQPDETIIFSKKKRLYHHSTQRNIFVWAGRVAAILIIAFAFFTLIDRPTNELVSENKVIKPVDKKEKKTVTKELKQIPVEVKKKDPIGIKQSTKKPAIKQTVPKQKHKSLRENTQGRMKHEDVAMNRTQIEIPAEMNSITASLNIKQPEAEMATMYITITPNSADYYEEKLFVDIVKEKTGINKFKFNKITKAGLNLVSSISKDKFKYETNNEGKITEYNYESRLLAFSIPSKNANPK